MAINIELRRKIGTSFEHEDSLLYPITTPENIVGLLDNGRIKEDFLPASVFGGMRFAGALDSSITTGTENDQTGDGTLGAIINAYIDATANGGTAIGVYFVASAAVTITATSAETFAPIKGGAAEEEGVQTNTVNLEPNDWIICKGVGTNGEYIFSVVNNTYRTVDANHAGLMTVAQHNKLAGIAAGANAYVHDTFNARNIDATGIKVLDVLTVNSEGHVTNATLRDFQDATTAQKGVTQLALDTDFNAGTLASDKVPAVDLTKQMIDYFTGNTLYSDTTTANAASHPDGAIVFVTASV